MRRPRSHRLEDESWIAFQHAMPLEWVVRRQYPDYALDVHVQLFENEVITPFLFFAQLKGTDANPRAEDTFSYSFQTGHLRHYLELPFPVMLAVYSSQQQRIRFEWVHDIYREADLDQRGRWHLQQTVTVSVRRDLASTSQKDLAREVKRYVYAMGDSPPQVRPFTLAFSSSYSSEDADSQFEGLRRCLSRWPFLRLVRHDAADGSISLLKEPSRLEYTVTEPQSVPLEEELSSEETWRRLSPTVLLGIALLLHAGGWSNEALDIVSFVITSAVTLPESSRFLVSAPALAELFALQGREAQALVLAEKLLDQGEWSPATMLFGVIVFSANPGYFEQPYRRLMGRMLDSPPDERCLGALHYNMGSSLYREGQFRLALKHYRLAGRSNPAYHQRPFWLNSVAHCLALLERFRVVETIYRGMLDDGCAGTHDTGRLGVALLYQGRLEEASVGLGEYLSSTDRPLAECVLHMWQVALIVAELGEKDFARHSIAARRVAKRLEDLPPESREEEARKAIELDPLCGAAWLVYAQESAADEVELFMRWFMAAMLLPSCEDVWMNAVGLLFHIVAADPSLQPDDVLAQLSDLLFAALRVAVGNFGPGFTDAVASRYGDPETCGKVSRLLAEFAGKAEHLFGSDSESPFHVECLDGSIKDAPLDG